MTPASNPARAPCRCGATDHARTNHRRCRFNKAGAATAPTQLVNPDIPDPLMGTQSAAQVAAAARAAEVRDRGAMSQNEFLDWLAASGHLTSPWYRVKLVDIQMSHDRRALLTALTAILRDMGQVSEGSNVDHATRRAYTKLLMLGRVLVRRPRGRVRMAKLNIHDWSTVARLRYLTEGRLLTELWDDSVALYPLGPQASQIRKPKAANPVVDVPAHMQIGVVEEDEDDTFLDECIRASREEPRSQRCDALAEPNSQEGLAIRYLLAQNLIGRAASRLTTEVKGSVDEAGTELLRKLHPYASYTPPPHATWCTVTPRRSCSYLKERPS
jgi:hypothetical protein